MLAPGVPLPATAQTPLFWGVGIRAGGSPGLSNGRLERADAKENPITRPAMDW